jgi:uncharacterized membrane protein
MKGTLVTIGIILLVLGIVGLMAKYSVTWMWLLIVLGVIGVIWGWMTKPEMK